MQKIGIFGGSFNPPHMGHVLAITSLTKKLGLNKVFVVPAGQNPLKPQIEGATPEQRLEMTKLAFSTYGDKFQIDDQEIKRKGKSYTIDTIKNYRKDYKAEELFLILGLDSFDGISDWKNLKDLLTETNLVVVTRPGAQLPESVDHLPAAVKDLVEEFEFNYVELKTGRNIQFVTIADVETSGTEVRKMIRAGRNIEKHLPLAVEKYIKEQKLYVPIGDKIGDYEKFAHFCADFLKSKKSIAVRAFDLRGMTAPSEFTIITSGTSTRHAASLAENLVQAVKDEYGVFPQSLEGQAEGRWVLVDYGSLIVHVFYDFLRQEYRLEDLWKNGKELSLKS